MNKRLKTVLEYAIMAPSGDNCQPWKLKVDGLDVELFNDPDKDTSLYNIKQRASLIAHGALLENINIASSSVGLIPKIVFFPDVGNGDHIATITFKEAEKNEHLLFTSIPQRHTNRELYTPVKISDSQIQMWKSLVENSKEEIWATNSKDQIGLLAKTLSLNDRLVFEVPELHRFLFEQIRWTDAEAKMTGDGLDIKTLGLNAMDKSAFRFLKNWSLVSGLNKIGFSRIIQLKAQQNLKTASSIAVITVSGSEALNYVKGGMTWQRLLLQLASEGLTAQPIAGLACLMQSNKESTLGSLAPHQRMKLSEASKSLREIVDVDDESTVIAIFRVGQGKPVIKALRRSLETFIQS